MRRHTFIAAALICAAALCVCTAHTQYPDSKWQNITTKSWQNPTFFYVGGESYPNLISYSLANDSATDSLKVHRKRSGATFDSTKIWLLLGPGDVYNLPKSANTDSIRVITTGTTTAFRLLITH